MIGNPVSDSSGTVFSAGLEDPADGPGSEISRRVVNIASLVDFVKAVTSSGVSPTVDIGGRTGSVSNWLGV